MKKLAIFLAIMLIPFSAFALDTISDNDLNDVTGQAGVSIYTNSINIVKTGVTTTYEDDGNEFTIVAGETDTSIFFTGQDPIMIDVVNMAELGTTLAFLTSNTDDPTNYGTSGVKITLPDSIIIQNNGSTKSYYTGGVTVAGADDSSERLITVTKTGGTTTISHVHGDTIWDNVAAANGLDHIDQIKIYITAHDDY